MGKKALRQMIDDQNAKVEHLSMLVGVYCQQLSDSAKVISNLKERVTELVTMAYPCPEGMWLDIETKMCHKHENGPIDKCEEEVENCGLPAVLPTNDPQMGPCVEVLQTWSGTVEIPDGVEISVGPGVIVDVTVDGDNGKIIGVGIAAPPPEPPNLVK